MRLNDLKTDAAKVQRYFREDFTCSLPNLHTIVTLLLNTCSRGGPL